MNQREIKFRALLLNKRMVGGDLIQYFTLEDVWAGDDFWTLINPETVMQFTGLKDKTSELAEVYEGDIIDSEGKIKGNIYESPQIYKEGTDLLIEGMGTEKWRNTESVAMGRGCKYA